MNTSAIIHYRIFAGIEPDDMTAITRSAVVIYLKRDTLLFADGDPATHLYAILSGQIRLYKLAANGRQSVFRIAGPGEVIGLSAIVPHSSYTLYAQTMTRCHILAWLAPTVQSLMEQYAILRQNCLQLLAEYREDLQEQLLELATSDVEQRLAKSLMRWMQRHSDTTNREPITVPLAQRDLADLIGASPYTVNRLLHKWQAEGVLQVQHGCLLVYDRQRLRAKAERA